MALLEMGGRKFTIPDGEAALGSAADCAIQLTRPGITPKTAILKGLPDGQVSIRKADPQSVIAVDGDDALWICLTGRFRSERQIHRASSPSTASTSAPSRHPSCTETRSRQIGRAS